MIIFFIILVVLLFILFPEGLKWKEGRGAGGYFNICILSLWRYDCHISKIPTGSKITPHYDPVDKRNHHRINITLGMFKGGDFIVEDVVQLKRWVRFRPDKQLHEVKEVTEGTCYMLSLGAAFDS